MHCSTLFLVGSQFIFKNSFVPMWALLSRFKQYLMHLFFWKRFGGTYRKMKTSFHYQTTEHCLATDNNRSTSSWKETGGARGGGGGSAPQIKFDLGKFYAVFKLL